ncbi:MAG: WbqC family protein [Bacteroidales bacterium]|nr:WbqC family protein [Bacteroidales bacterium]HOI31310.1 WbqC family protein [Bacteroidales bacterium]
MPYKPGFVALQHMTGLFSTAYFPPISYFSKLINCNKIVFEAEETYIKQSYRNRCIILSANGIQKLVVPVKKPNGTHSKTKVITPDYSINWPVQHLRSLHAAYKSSPYYDYYIHYFEEILLSIPATSLLSLNNTLLKKIAALLKTDLEISYTDVFIKNPDGITDFRSYFNPKVAFPVNSFEPYYQVFGDKFTFHPDLSILDLLFNEGPQSIFYLKKLILPNPDRQS